MLRLEAALLLLLLHLKVKPCLPVEGNPLLIRGNPFCLGQLIQTAISAPGLCSLPPGEVGVAPGPPAAVLCPAPLAAELGHSSPQLQGLPPVHSAEHWGAGEDKTRVSLMFDEGLRGWFGTLRCVTHLWSLWTLTTLVLTYFAHPAFYLVLPEVEIRQPLAFPNLCRKRKVGGKPH